MQQLDLTEVAQEVTSCSIWLPLIGQQPDGTMSQSDSQISVADLEDLSRQFLQQFASFQESLTHFHSHLTNQCRTLLQQIRQLRNRFESFTGPSNEDITSAVIKSIQEVSAVSTGLLGDHGSLLNFTYSHKLKNAVSIIHLSIGTIF